jgi:hypothetical protein
MCMVHSAWTCLQCSSELHPTLPEQKLKKHRLYVAVSSPVEHNIAGKTGRNSARERGALMQHPAQQKGSNWAGTFMSQ